MKTSQLVLGILVSTFSLTASADYFACQIEQGASIIAATEADYRILEASVAAEGYICEGKINNVGETEVSLSDSNRSVTATAKGSKATVSLSTVPRHNELDVTCTCGMQ